MGWVLIDVVGAAYCMQNDGRRRHRHRRSSALHGYHVADYNVAWLAGGVVRDFEAVACARPHFSWALVVVYR